MSTEQVVLWLLIVGAPAATAFPIAYMLTAPWYASLVGRAIVMSKIGLAMLFDSSLAYHYLGPTYPGRPAFLITSLTLVVIGTWLYLVALIHEQVLIRR